MATKVEKDLHYSKTQSHYKHPIKALIDRGLILAGWISQNRLNINQKLHFSKHMRYKPKIILSEQARFEPKNYFIEKKPVRTKCLAFGTKPGCTKCLALGINLYYTKKNFLETPVDTKSLYMTYLI